MMVCLRMGKTYTAKTPLSDFKVSSLENPLLSKQMVTVKESQYLIPTYSWIIILMLNWTCSIVRISHFQCMSPNTWLTNYADFNTRLNHQLEKDVAAKFFSSSHDKDQETPWTQNPTVYKHSNFFKRKMN